MKLSIVIPAYNEEKTIKEILTIIENVDLSDLGVSKEIIVVDDGSKDNTIDIVKQIKNVVLIISEKNEGKGSAVRKGIAATTGDIIIIQDADLEYDPNEYPKLITPIINGEAKVVYGSRYLSQIQKEKNIDFLKKKHKSAYDMAYLGGRVLTIIANILYNAKITDEPTCYKVFKADVLKSINLKCKRFEFCPEVTAKVRKKGYRIHEIPITYRPRTFEEGKKINWKDGVEAIWVLIKYRFTN